MAFTADVHCHTFNTADLPVRGFVHRVILGGAALTVHLATLADILASSAPGYYEEKQSLDRLLAPAQLAATFGADTDKAPVPVEPELDVDADIARVQASHPGLLEAIGAEMAAATAAQTAGEADVAAAGMFDQLSAMRRAVKWVRLIRSSRLVITQHLVKNFGDRIDLFTPMLVDLGTGLSDTADTTAAQQMVLNEKISRLSMVGRLPGVTRARLHPFVGFDPLRELRARLVGDITTPLDELDDAIKRFGFVGVKVYPPMGWRPLGNDDDNGPMPRDRGKQLDRVLRDFYDWCHSNDVPVTAHGSRSNAAAPPFLDCGAPSHWGQVLDEFPDLHLNLGHFGGSTTTGPGSWMHQIAELMGQHQWLFADVGNHRVDDPGVLRSYFAALRALFADPTTAAASQRLMFGSDWLMLALLPDHDAFLDTYKNHYEHEFGEELTSSFMGGAALRFLGFDDPKNANCARLRERYANTDGAESPPWLA